MNKKKVLITGACGFLGRNTVLYALDHGFEVYAWCRPGGKAVFGKRDGLFMYTVDMQDARMVADTLAAISPDHVIHLAASNISSGAITSSHDVIQTNILGTEHLLKAAEAAQAVSFVSMGSFLEYGPSTEPFREDGMCQPLEIYSISKLGQTLLTQSYGRTGKLNTIAFRLFTPYGPYIQKGRLIENVISRSLRGEDIQLTAKSVSRDFMYVDDICDLLFEAVEHPQEHTGQIYNLGSGVARNLEEVVGVIQNQVGTQSNVVWGGFANVLYDTDTCVASMEKTFHDFSWRPKTSFEDGIAQTIQAIKRNLDL